MNTEYAKIVLDSVGPHGVRLTSVEVKYWRMIHSEIMTHRDRARSSASSRAIPFYREGRTEKTAKEIEEIGGVIIGEGSYNETSLDAYKYIIPKCMYAMIEREPFIPEFIGQEQQGMQSGEELSGAEREEVIQLIHSMREFNLAKCKRMYELGAHKSIINRYVEPWMYITVLMTATRWRNFFRLRIHPAAEKHFNKVAKMIKAVIDKSVPKVLKPGEWHLPYLNRVDVDPVTGITLPGMRDEHDKIILVDKVVRDKYESDDELSTAISAGRCARVSYLTHEGKRDHNEDVKLFETLINRDKDSEGRNLPHACYDGDTDVLTEYGWMNWKDIKGCEKFATLNMQFNRVEYQLPIETYSGKEYKGSMIKVKGIGVDLFVTPEHKMYACIMEGEEKNKFGLISAYNLHTVNHCYTKNTIRKDNFESDYYSNELLELLGFALGDSCNKNGNNLTFHLKKFKKIEYLKELCTKLKIDLKELTHDTYQIKYPFEFEIYDSKGDKCLPQDIVMKSDCYPIYLGLMNSDNCVDEKGEATFTKVLYNQMCHILFNLGFPFNSKLNGKIYEIQILKDQFRPEVNRTSNYEARTELIENWEGKIYCVTVPNHTLYVRRNGIPIWSGNSALEHVARCETKAEYKSGPYNGWHQLRKDFPAEDMEG